MRRKEENCDEGKLLLSNAGEQPFSLLNVVSVRSDSSKQNASPAFNLARPVNLCVKKNP